MVRVRKEPSKRFRESGRSRSSVRLNGADHPGKPNVAALIDLTGDSDESDNEGEERIASFGQSVSRRRPISVNQGSSSTPKSQVNDAGNQPVYKAGLPNLSIEVDDHIAKSLASSATEYPNTGDEIYDPGPIERTCNEEPPIKKPRYWKLKTDFTPASAESSASSSTLVNYPATPDSGTSVPTAGVSIAYLGPVLTEISVQAITLHLDKEWKQSRWTRATLKRLASWWKPTPVARSHPLDKEQMWLLAHATYEWWKALESEWKAMSSTDSIKDKSLGPTMRDCRARKEITLAKSEGGCGGARLDVSAVYRLGDPLPKTEKPDIKGTAKKDPSVDA